MVPGFSDLEEGYGLQGSMLIVISTRHVEWRIAAQELSLSGKESGMEIPVPASGHGAMCASPHRSLTRNLYRFSGDRTLTGFTLVDYLATSLLPLTRERYEAIHGYESL